MDKYQEHLQDSAPDNSRWDGFDRGDLGPGIGPEESYQPTEAEMDAIIAEQHAKEQADLAYFTDLQLEQSEIREELISIARHDAYADWLNGDRFDTSNKGKTYRWAYDTEFDWLNIGDDIPF
jgi:hypothetical protein